jgi:glucose-6-phosphate 1-dehydrogenase
MTQTAVSEVRMPFMEGPVRADPCLLVVFGAAGDLTKRLLMPALYNLACAGLLPEHWALLGVSREPMDDDKFRAHLNSDIRRFSTRPTFDEAVWTRLSERLHFLQGDFADAAAFRRLAELTTRLAAQYQIGGNRLYYLATPPVVFGLIAGQLGGVGLSKPEQGWARLVVEKPFGNDLKSAAELNRTLLRDWREEQIYRIDHYLGKETVQNLSAFRFANGIFEPLWNKQHVDHIQMNVAETVGVETRGGYYDRTGVLRDMMQNHMFQMLAYLCMEPPSSITPEAVRNEKAKLLDSMRVYTPAEVARNAVRGQYAAGKKADGSAAAGYREEPAVAPASTTETFAALRLFIDNWRWEGVPIYLRSGKSLWKRGTEIVVQFKKAPDVLFRGMGTKLESNRLIFHIQPDQGIEFRFQAKTPGTSFSLQNVDMRFDYREAFDAPRTTGYEVLFYSCLLGDATLFSRTDLVELAWRIAQPVLDHWAAEPPADFPNYPAGSWGPKTAYDLLERDGRQWVEVINRSVLERVPLFRDCSPLLLQDLALALKPTVRAAGEYVVRKGEPGAEMYFISRGSAEALDGAGRVLNTLSEGDFFGELSLLFAQPRAATIRTLTYCDLFVLDQADFNKVMKNQPELALAMRDNARKRYHFDTEPGSAG